MIITRTPFRVPLGGGGTDLPTYYQQYGGFIFAAAIDKYMFININRPIVDDLVRIKYSKSETVASVDEVQHEIAREALRHVGIANAIEIVSLADLPAGTGMGSSSAYTVGLLNGLHTLQRDFIPLPALAEEACRLEIEILGKPIGKQDQYLATFGGLTLLEIDRDGRVQVRRAKVTRETIDELERTVLIFHTGTSRDSLEILAGQSRATAAGDRTVVESLHRIKDIGLRIHEAIEAGDLTRFGRLLDEHWQTKKRLSTRVTDPRLDGLYDLGLRHGGLGGKVMGAGGGGFFMFYCEAGAQRLRTAMAAAGLRELRYRFDFEGTKVLSNF